MMCQQLTVTPISSCSYFKFIFITIKYFSFYGNDFRRHLRLKRQNEEQKIIWGGGHLPPLPLLGAATKCGCNTITSTFYQQTRIAHEAHLKKAFWSVLEAQILADD